jgi:predicted dehydrogenase
MQLPPAASRPRRLDWRIGVVGTGFIAGECHLPAYRKAGYNPVAVASRRRESAEATAGRFGIPRVFESAEALLDDASIEVLDVAVPPAAQAGVIRAACARSKVKGILAQKPLGVSYAEARELVECCEAAGIVLAVNQNMRHDPSVRAAATLLREGALGAPVLASIDMRAIPHWMPWQRDLGWVTLRIMSIHHLDCFRHWFGTPERIFCSVRTDPRTQFPHRDGIAAYILEYADGLRCMALDDTWAAPAKEGCPADIRIEWRIEGTDGLAVGDIGWCKNPYTSPSALRWARKGDAAFRSVALEGSWFPDAFAGTMGDLLVALETGATPVIGGRDNLETMALVEAAYLSVESGRAVAVSEVTRAGG